MIITFCGHSEIYGAVNLKERILSAIEEVAKDADEVLFYLGGYGQFDILAATCCRVYRENHPEAKLIFYSPYYSESYFRRRAYYLDHFDQIIIAETEETPKRFAIAKRNRLMIEAADYLIAYVNHGWGGAVATLKHAITHQKPFINLGTMVF